MYVNKAKININQIFKSYIEILLIFMKAIQKINL